MTELITHAIALGSGAGIVWLLVRDRLAQLARLTDRDERGRFVRREP